MDSTPVMTDSERRAYGYGQAASRLGGMRKSWSNESLASSYYARATCVCAPTTHPGSFRCKHHRHHASSNLDTAAPSLPPPPPQETHHAAPPDNQEKSSSS
jgi:hypothetical protein